jgi:hypothetical protein
MSMKPVSATQGLKDLFAPAASSTSISTGSGVSNNDSTRSMSSLPFSYIPYASIDPSTLAKAAAAAAPTASGPVVNAPPAPACGPLPPPPPPPPTAMSAVAKRIQEGKDMARKKMRTLHWSIIPKVRVHA